MMHNGYSNVIGNGSNTMGKLNESTTNAVQINETGIFHMNGPPPIDNQSTDKSMEKSNGHAANGTHSASPPIHPQPWCGQNGNSSGADSSKHVYNYGGYVEKERTAMCRIAELARYHKLKHEYKLMDESGPAHRKMFTVQLVLAPNQIFEGSGPSIKKAQQAAAAVAIKETTFLEPPDRNSKKKKSDMTSPVLLLSHVCRRLGIADPKYQHPMIAPRKQPPILPPPFPYSASPPLPPGKFPLMNDPFPMPLPPPMQDFSPQPPGTPTSPHRICPTSPFTPPPLFPAALPQSPILPPPPLHFPVIPSVTGPPRPLPMNSVPSLHAVTVLLQGMSAFTAYGNSYMKAKCNAATQALTYLGPVIQELEKNIKEEENRTKKMRLATIKRNHSKEEPNEDEDENNENAEEVEEKEEKLERDVGILEEQNGEIHIPSHRQKSVISHVHEYALQMKLNVEFEVLVEKGPPHDRSYIVRCSLRDNKGNVSISADGHGRKKKDATKEACSHMLVQLNYYKSSPLFLATSIYKSQKKINNPPRESKRKTIVKDKKMDPTYGHQINPVSRLIQVLQAKNEGMASFELIGEHGQSRYKEFVVQVKCGERVCEGKGPNKRLAKRAAAEAMLALIGYVKPLPPPGKSLLKKKNDPNSIEDMAIGVFDINETKQVLERSASEDDKVIDMSDMAKELNDIEEKQNSSFLRVETPSSNSLTSSSPSPQAADTSYGGETGEEPASTIVKRRVTFSNQVKACPPPDDDNYPQAEMAPLKTEVVFEGKTKRMKKTKEGKKSLDGDQIQRVHDAVHTFISAYCLVKRSAALPSEGEPRIETARRYLDWLAESFEFTVQYTNFPKSFNDGKANQEYFALVTLGLTPVLVAHGTGETTEAAMESAGYNALCALTDYPNNIKVAETK